MQPVKSNGLSLDTRMLDHYGDMMEFEKSYALFSLDRRARCGRSADATRPRWVRSDPGPVRQAELVR